MTKIETVIHGQDDTLILGEGLMAMALGPDQLIIGFDYWNTATQNPGRFAALACAIRDTGGKVYIITAVGPKRASSNVDEVKALGVPNDGIYQVVFDKPQDAPRLKADKAVELGIQLFIDDRRDICEEMLRRGILACNILKPLL